MDFRIFLKPLAYLDPGSGSLIIQMALAAILGAGAFISIFWKKIKGWLNRNEPFDDAENDPTDIQDDIEDLN